MFLVIVDPQRGFFDPAVPDDLEGRLERLLSCRPFRAVIATRFVSEPNGPFDRFADWGGLHGTEQDICAGVRPWLDAIVPKKGFSGATGPVLLVLRKLNSGHMPQAVFLAGTDTEACVLATAMAFFEKGVRPIALADYWASSGGRSVHEAGLLCLERAIGPRNVMRGDPDQLTGQWSVKTESLSDQV